MAMFTTLVVLITIFISSLDVSYADDGETTKLVSKVKLKIVNKLEDQLKVTLYANSTNNDYTKSSVSIGAGVNGSISIKPSTPTTSVKLVFEVNDVIYFDGESVLKIAANKKSHRVVVSTPCPTEDGLYYKTYASGKRTNQDCALPKSNE